MPQVKGDDGSTSGIQPGGFFGVWGDSKNGYGVVGTNLEPPPILIHGRSGGVGVAGKSDSGTGVEGTSTSSYGVVGKSTSFTGVEGTSSAKGFSGVAAINDSGGFGLWARGTPAGHFVGDVEVTGDIKLLGGDCAEEFDIATTTAVDPGTVMVLDQQGALRPSQQAYDKKVAGVISGAGDYKPGLILDKKEPSESRMPVALVGKVYCKVDAQYASIEVGDLLTTSPTPGYAMKADDPFKAFGAVIGKALRPFREGQGLIPILIALQ